MSELVDNARKLREMAAILPDLSEIMGTPVEGEVIEYECDVGSCTGFYMFKREDDQGWACQRARLSAGTQLKRHAHPETEVLVVLYGRISIILNNEAQPVERRGVSAIVFQPGAPHTVTALENTELVGIIVPSSPGYPSRGSGD